MFSALQFVIILALTVLTSGLHKCPHPGHYYTLNDNEYDIYDGEIEVDKSVRKLINYTDVFSTTIRFSARVKQSRDNEDSQHVQNDNRYWELVWKHKGHAVVSNILVSTCRQSENLKDNILCQIMTFTTNEEWIVKNASNSYKITNLPADWFHISEDVKTRIRNLGLSCLKENICPVKNPNIYNCPSVVEKISPLIQTVTINREVDRSLKKTRKNIKKRNDTIQIPDTEIDFTSVIVYCDSGVHGSGGTFTNLSTIERIGDATATVQGDVYYSINITYILREARIHYKTYKIQKETVEHQGEMSVSVKDLIIQRDLTSDVTNCHPVLQHINITRIGELKYEFRRRNMNVEDDSFKSQGQIYSWVQRYVKQLIESFLVPALKNLFKDEHLVYGPCMANEPETGFDMYT